jgi:hypothetical protein
MKTRGRIICHIIFSLAYPIFYWLDRHIVPSSNVFWHRYMQDLVMPGYFLAFLGLSLQFVVIGRKTAMKILVRIGIYMFLFGISLEIHQGPEGDKWDVLCYFISILTGLLVSSTLLRFRDNLTSTS